jgi:O-antigen/teichoic acid export membrane protein
VISRSAMLGALVLQGMVFALGPRIAALFATGEYQQAQRLYRTSTTWIVAASAPAFVVLLWFPSAFLRLFSNQTAADDFAFRILIAATLVNLAAGPVGAVLLMAGRSTWNLMNAATGLALALAIAIWTVPVYGATGAALGWGTSIVVQNVLAVTQIWRGFRMHPFTRMQGAASLLAAIVLGAFSGALYSLMGDSSEAAALAFLVGSAAYAVVLLRVLRRYGLADVMHVLRGQPGRDLTTDSWTRAAVRASVEGGS